MVQGNLLALTFTHWAIASRTGIIAGALASAALLALRTSRRWVVAVVLGTLTAAVDYVVHPGAFGPAIAEAVVTGAGATALSLLVHAAITRMRRQKAEAASL